MPVCALTIHGMLAEFEWLLLCAEANPSVVVPAPETQLVPAPVVEIFGRNISSTLSAQ
jgi:hypothetical protein